MSLRQIPKLRIGDLEVNIPLIQGGMGVGISLSGLASAVANEGGIGVISTAGIGMLEPDFNRSFKEANNRALRREIKKARGMTAGVIGINIMVALTDYSDLLQAALDEGADVVFLGAGLPLKIPENLLADKPGKHVMKVVPIVSSARAAKLIFHYWERNYQRIPDGVVVEGPLAGGHLGFSKAQIDDPEYALEKILPEVIATLRPFEESFNRSIPVIAAGGIYTGGDIYRYLKSGAQGVQMATRFVATNECDASPAFKEAYVNCNKEDLTIIESPVGLPGRAIKNKFLEMVAKGIKKPVKCPWKCLKTCDFTKSPYCIGAALTNAKKGILEKGFAFAGANAYRVNAITSVKELIKTLLSEYKISASIGERLEKKTLPKRRRVFYTGVPV
ncbi:MAG: nitronate monooxygenase [Dehalococcoidales bacterium]|jgi:NAD(P)H-dependent flavin oxidoreductase YrpB (nitropropane dioxygenase family)